MRPGKNIIGVVGDLCLDLLVRGDVTPRYRQEEQWVDDYEVTLGGSGAIFASQCVKLRQRVKLAGLVGSDPFGSIILSELHRHGIPAEDIRISPTGKTPLGLGLLRRDERAMLTCAGTYREITPEWVLQTGILENIGHLHLCSFYLLPQLQELWTKVLPSLKAKSVTVSLDTNWDPEGCWGGLSELWQHIDVFLPNAQEAMAISRTTSTEAACRDLEKKVPVTVIKDGADGALLCRGNGPEHFPLPPALLAEAPVADTTGAGDSFDGGFISAWLAGASLPECMELGLRCGTKSTQQMGGLAGQWKSTEEGMES